MRKTGVHNHGYSQTKTHHIWRSMKYRCGRLKNYEHITYFEEWEYFDNFLKDMGWKPDGKSLDRIDNKKGYYPSNCRWATDIQQARNRSNNRLVRGKTLGEWAEITGINVVSLRNLFYKKKHVLYKKLKEYETNI